MKTPAALSSATMTTTTSSRRGALVALYFATVAVFSDMYIAQPILPLLSREFGVSPATAGLSVSAVVLSIALASSLYGPVSDAFGRKPVMVVTTALLALPTLACAVAPSFPALLVFRAAQGVLIPGLTAVAVAYIGDAFAGAELGAAVGGYIAASVAGGLTGRVVSGLIADRFAWREAFVFFAATTLLAAMVIARALPRVAVRAKGSAVGWGSAYRGMFRHFRDRRLVGAFLIGGTLFFAFIGVFTYLPYHLTGEPFRLSTGAVAGVYVVYLAGVIVSPFAGRFSRRFPRPAIMAAGMLICAVALVGTLIPSVPAIVVSLVVLCIGMFTAQSTAPAYVNATATTAKGGASALYLAFYYGGATLGSTLPGLAWQTFGWGGVVATCATGLALGLLANWFLCR